MIDAMKRLFGANAAASGGAVCPEPPFALVMGMMAVGMLVGAFMAPGPVEVAGVSRELGVMPDAVVSTLAFDATNEN